MFSLTHIKAVYFLGIGGIGMSALARYFIKKNIAVFGYDKVRTALCKKLETEGATIHYLEDISQIPLFFHTPSKEYLVVYTPAIPSNSLELKFFIEQNIVLQKRAQVLGLISQNSFTIAIAGTHGKTTTSSMFATALYHAGINFTAFLGGLSVDLGSNYFDFNKGASLVDKIRFGECEISPHLFLNTDGSPKDVIVVEADEYDRSFLSLNPSLAVLTSTDADHLDIYQQADGVTKGFQDFVNQISVGGALLYFESTSISKPPSVRSFSYGSSLENDFSCQNMKYDHRLFSFDFIKSGKSSNYKLGIDGVHNAWNATAVLVAFDVLGLGSSVASIGLEKFKGVNRRFQVVFESQDYILIDDYAHHPTELDAIILSVKNKYPERKITGVFQPHLFTRTRDFLDEFAQSLSALDNCYLLDIYPARELPIPGVTSAALATKIPNCKGVFSPSDFLSEMSEKTPPVLLILGAGDIDLLVPSLKEIYETANSIK